MRSVFTFIFLMWLSSQYAFAITSSKQALTIQSKELGHDLTFNVYLPFNYDENNTKQYPLLVTSAGSSRMIMVQAQLDWLTHVDFGPMPQMIMVQLPDIEQSSKEQVAQGGHTQLFAKVLHSEVYPLIRKSYRVAPYTVIEGFSSRGNLALELFAMHPLEYQAAVIASPALEVAPNAWHQSLHKSLGSTLKGRFLYLSLGNFAGNRVYFEQLKAQYQHVGETVFDDLSEQNYMSGPILSFERGAKAVFSDMYIDNFEPYAKLGIHGVLEQQQIANKKYGYDMPADQKLLDLANYYFAQKRKEKGKEVFEYLTSNNPNNIIYRLRYGQALLNAKQAALAKPQLQKALALAEVQNNAEAQGYITRLVEQHFN